jgi:PGF-pre-PGF domain-containing protein
MYGVAEITKTVIVPPYSDFNVNITSGIAPLEVNFTDKSKGVPEIWNLSFGDGNFYNTTGSFPAGVSHVYEKAGYYTVSLSTERNGIYNTTTRKNIIAAGINASFSADSLSGFAPLKVSFNDTSQGSPDTWEWDFDDGTISHEKNTMHTFTSSGIYYVTLNASSGVFYDTYSVLINVSRNPSSGGSGSSYYSGQESQPETDNNCNISTACGYDLTTGDIFSFSINTGVIRKFSAAVGENINRVKFEVEKITDWEGLFKPPLLPVYGYEKIRIYWAPESSIVTSSVSFDVSREWLLGKGMTKDDVTFLIYSSKNSTWAGLPVAFEGCNDEYCSYSARIPEFSYYAVSAEKNTVYMPENSIEVKGLEAKSKTNSLEITKKSSLTPAKTKSPDSDVEYITDTRAMPLDFVIPLFSLFLVLFIIRKFQKE